jgi:hypothetical protein
MVVGAGVPAFFLELPAQLANLPPREITFIAALGGALAGDAPPDLASLCERYTGLPGEPGQDLRFLKHDFAPFPLSGK